MKNFDDFIKYLADNDIATKIFNEVKKDEKITQAEMFMAFISLLREYHDWLNH